MHGNAARDGMRKCVIILIKDDEALNELLDHWDTVRRSGRYVCVKCAFHTEDLECGAMIQEVIDTFVLDVSTINIVLVDTTFAQLPDRLRIQMLRMVVGLSCYPVVWIK
jgi:hypothetical protein